MRNHIINRSNHLSGNFVKYFAENSCGGIGYVLIINDYSVCLI